MTSTAHTRATEAPPSELSYRSDWPQAEPPDWLKLACRWLLWKTGERRKPDGTIHLAKVPCYTDGTRRRGDLNIDGDRLVGYAEACAALALWGDQMAGLGFALGADGRGGYFQGIDFDKIDERPELAALVAQLPGYVEWSPSGRGVHALGYGAPFGTLGPNNSGIEAYCESRFFTFTGKMIRAGLV